MNTYTITFRRKAGEAVEVRTLNAESGFHAIQALTTTFVSAIVLHMERK